MRFPDLLRDPLIRLVMESDGVTEQEMIALMDQLRRALAARERRIRSVRN
jgi:DNA invertase Pin-like site-specific DNA recombinase